ncbi:MAG: hypothetical protein GXO74_16525 [Calditrichaeota bacterium]|nr:hypothetical protein [Calditrichota bacterium]
MKKKASIDRILQSEEFKDSPTYKELLQYLYEYSLTGAPPKESTIAAEFFKSKDLNTERDAKVRVYMHNLRKKLDSYYLNEGKDDKIKITIPKGHYLLEFATREPAKRKRRLLQFIIANVLIVGLLIIINLIYLSHQKKQAAVTNGELIKNDLIWGDFFNSDKQTLLVFGDYFLYKDTVSVSHFFIRNPRINSREDFQKFIFENPEYNKRFNEAELTFLGKHAVWCLEKILRLYILTNQKFKLKLASHLQWEDFQNNNIIFVGSFKTLRIMRNYMKQVNFHYRVFPNTLYYYDNHLDSTFAYHAPRESQTGHVTDYALVTKLPGPKGNVIMTFSSTHDIGHISVVQSFTNNSFLQKIEQEHKFVKNNVKFFEAVFEVTGFERTGFRSSLLHFNRISAGNE